MQSLSRLAQIREPQPCGLLLFSSFSSPSLPLPLLFSFPPLPIPLLLSPILPFPLLLYLLQERDQNCSLWPCFNLRNSDQSIWPRKPEGKGHQQVKDSWHGGKGREQARLGKVAAGVELWQVTHHNKSSPSSRFSWSILAGWNKRPQGKKLRPQVPGTNPKT